MIRHNISKQINRIGEAAKDFSLALYEEHLSEISYYYEQLTMDADEAYQTWLETKINPHIKALKSDDELAMEYCRMRAETGDAGIVYTLGRLFSHRQKGKEQSHDEA